MFLTRTVAPAAPILSTAEAKERLGVLHSDHDTMIAALVAAAEAVIDGPEGAAGVAMVNQTWTAALCAPVTARAEIRVPLVPFVSLDAISYFDADNAQQSLDVAAVSVVSDAGRTYLRPVGATSWPSMYDRRDAMTVTLTIGHGAAASNVPKNLVQAAAMLVGHYYDNREAAVVGAGAVEVPFGVRQLIGISRAGWVR